MQSAKRQENIREMNRINKEIISLDIDRKQGKIGLQDYAERRGILSRQYHNLWLQNSK